MDEVSYPQQAAVAAEARDSEHSERASLNQASQKTSNTSGVARSSSQKRSRLWKTPAALAARRRSTKKRRTTTAIPTIMTTLPSLSRGRTRTLRKGTSLAASHDSLAQQDPLLEYTRNLSQHSQHSCSPGGKRKNAYHHPALQRTNSQSSLWSDATSGSDEDDRREHLEVRSNESWSKNLYGQEEIDLVDAYADEAFEGTDSIGGLPALPSLKPPRKVRNRRSIMLLDEVIGDVISFKEDVGYDPTLGRYGKHRSHPVYPVYLEDDAVRVKPNISVTDLSYRRSFEFGDEAAKTGVMTQLPPRAQSLAPTETSSENVSLPEDRSVAATPPHFGKTPDVPTLLTPPASPKRDSQDPLSTAAHVTPVVVVDSEPLRDLDSAYSSLDRKAREQKRRSSGATHSSDDAYTPSTVSDDQPPATTIQQPVTTSLELPNNTSVVGLDRMYRPPIGPRSSSTSINEGGPGVTNPAAAAAAKSKAAAAKASTKKETKANSQQKGFKRFFRRMSRAFHHKV
ncbi:uncharacterized protein EV422DRAFT_564832 [Fimicolochytrium jonesii]|uniref:uncharacterized protein n=1 Tax=Fimicolochytrium jonesii TaxID=1396493 RepID=UPI0022FF2B29|nr:uncharacterized protein EV422DRAFT_564832 [Fimicolochytrium jonesii]KAI8824121.1 hypothetical protein EV422DRAFT_564832 [Fimicolochytrium jonesii]